MLLFRRVSKGGKQLDTLDRSIVIHEVDPGHAQEDVTAVDKMGGFGQTITATHWRPLEASVTYAIDIYKTKMKKRREVFDLVNAWAANPGYIKMPETMGDRRLYADKIVLPNSGDLWNWLADYTIVFRALSVPFWEDSTETTQTVKKIKADYTTLDVPGTAPTVLNLNFENISGKTITYVNIRVNNDPWMTFTGLNLAADETLQISHDEKGVISFKAGRRNVIKIREGADDLYLNPGSNKITIDAQRNGKLTLSTRGRWM